MVSVASAALVLMFTLHPAAVTRRDLASVQRLESALSRQHLIENELQRVAAAADIAMIRDAIVGRGAGVAERDALAYSLLGLGYSAKEAADIVSGRISKQALDMAHAMRLAGRGREAAADFVDRQYSRVALSLAPSVNAAIAIPAAPRISPTARATRTATIRAVAATPATSVVSAAPFDAAIVKYARLNAVDPALIRAVISAESRFAANARSSAGAIGLMQLMPATAHALGVNPHVTEENIEGGVRYLAGLLKTFGGVELALVAYNAGPSHAQRYARGESSLYGETREFVTQVLSRMHAPR